MKTSKRTKQAEPSPDRVSSAPAESKPASKANAARVDVKSAAGPAVSKIAPKQLEWWHVAAGLVLALFFVFQIYGPALNGPFVYDDSYLPFLNPNIAGQPFNAWMGVRPILMATFWWNYRTHGAEPYPYHAFNVVLHALNGLLVFAILRQLLGWAGAEGKRREALSLAGALLFLAHPVQTESVAYVASRSETLSVFFFLAAFAMFLYRRDGAIRWWEALIVIACTGAAVLTKEHTAVLPVLLVLTDVWFRPTYSIRNAIYRNWMVYVPMALGGLLAARFILRVLQTSDSAGFAMKDLRWHEYFFTQWRAIWVYIRTLILPVDLNLDYDFPISRSPADHLAWLGLLGLLALTVAAWRYRERFPLASYGFFVFLLLLAPTSSIAPIRDVVVERRLYLPFIGFALIAVDLARAAAAMTTGRILTAAGVVTIVLSFATLQRNQLWADPLKLWEDTVAKSPAKARPRFQLAYANYTAGRCNDAVKHYEETARLQKIDYQLVVDWALAADCAGRAEEAVAKARQATMIEPSAHSYSMLGMFQAKRGNHEDALASLATAEKLNPNDDVVFAYRGNVYLALQRNDMAADEFQKALQRNAGNQIASEGLKRLRAQQQQQQRQGQGR